MESGFRYKAVSLGSDLAPVVLSTAVPKEAKRILDRMKPEQTTNLSFFRSTITLDRQTDYLRGMFESNTDLLCVVDHTKSRLAIGTVGLHEIDIHNGMARLGLLIFNQADRRKGFGRAVIQTILRYAFDVLKLNKVYLKVFAENDRARNLYEALGFRAEGTLRQEYLLDGKYHDMTLMSILKSEFAEQSTK